jgi:hypothetical protein
MNDLQKDILTATMFITGLVGFISTSAKRRAKLSRVLGKRALKSFHPRLFNDRLFAGETWSDKNGCNCRNQTASFC